MTIAGGVYFPLDCHLDPARLMASLQRRLESAGVHFSFSTEVKGWRLQGTRISGVETSGGICTAEEFVVAGGAWSPAMVRALGVKIPMLPGKGYSLTLPQPRQRPRLCSILAEARVAVTPMGSSLRVGGTMEIGDFSPTIRRKRVKGIIESIPSYFPDFRTADFKDVPVWSGLRPCSPDGLPYLGRFHPYPNLTVATGHAMMGLSLGPVTGQLVAALLAGQRLSIELSQLSPNRYA
jgi:D-amino-acid dehydrogenase